MTGERWQAIRNIQEGQVTHDFLHVSRICFNENEEKNGLTLLISVIPSAQEATFCVSCMREVFSNK